MQEEDYIQSVISNLRELKRKRRAEEKAIMYNALKPNTASYSTPYMRECFKKEDLAKKDLKDITKDTVVVNRDAVRRDLKRRQRFAWKDPGYAGEAFGPTLALKNNVKKSSFNLFRCLANGNP